MSRANKAARLPNDPTDDAPRTQHRCRTHSPCGTAGGAPLRDAQTAPDGVSPVLAMIQPHGLILMGGKATRMGGGDKGLLPLGETTILAHVLDRLSPQVDRIALNANGDPARLNHLNLPVLPDGLPDHPGPLAGTLAGLEWAAAIGATHIVTAAADTPFLPCDLVPRLLLAGQDTGFALAASPGGRQPTFGLWPVSLRGPLRQALLDGLRKIIQFTQAHGAGTADFTDDAAFFNINTPDDLITAEALLESPTP